MALTGHFINRPEWKYRTALLGCSELQKGTTSNGTLINMKVRTILDEMDIDSANVSAATTDGGGDMVSGIQIMKKRRVPCGAHGGQKSGKV